MDYIIEQILEVSDAKFGKRVKFKIEGIDGPITTFTKFPDSMTVGAKITGTITESQYGKDFKFGSRSPAPQSSGNNFQVGNAEILNAINLKLIPMLQLLGARIDRIEKFVTGDAALDEAFSAATKKDEPIEEIGF
jgi:hypothetical protein